MWGRKYCSTFGAFAEVGRDGVSMIELSGLAIRPRMPASWRICATFAAGTRVGHRDGLGRALLLDFLPWRSSVFCFSQLAHHALDTSSPVSRN